MEFVVGLLIASVLVYGWFRGSILAAIFLSLGLLSLMLLLANPVVLAIGVGLLGVTWAPVVLRNRRRTYPILPQSTTYRSDGALSQHGISR
jgi:hypothetical protein